MIKLQRGEKPEYLTEDKVEQLTKEYAATEKSVWNKKQIKNPLSESSSHKCAYCETDLTDPSTYMEVEHFYPKSLHPDLVVAWDNLLPSCKRCNGAKNDEDISERSIINPYETDPRNEFYFDHFSIFGLTEVGENTETLLDLNEEDLFIKRCRVAGAAKNSLVQISREFLAIEKLDGWKRNRFKAVLKAAQSDRPYAAFVATIIHNEDAYETIKKRLIDEKLWTNELESLHNQSLGLVLPLRS